METPFDLVASVVPGRESWRLKVRVLRLWNVFSFANPQQVNSVEMVLIDEKGVKIHGSVRRQLLYLFESKISEGKVYKMSNFTVVAESGGYRATSHPYKLIFQMKTKVQISVVDSKIDCHGLSLSSIGDICGQECDPDFLVDVIGVITGISGEREYLRDGKVTKMIIIELSDNSGKVECALFGDYVVDLQKNLPKKSGEMAIAVIQFAKIKIFRGKLSIQNVINATRVFINPSLQHAVAFKESLSIEGIENSLPIPLIGGRGKPSFEEDFLEKYPKISLGDLVEVVEDGVYVVPAVISGLVGGEEWWYPACKCHRSVSSDSGAYYCRICVKHIFKMVPRFRLKVNVESGDASAVFVLFDADMNFLLGKSCRELVSGTKEQDVGAYPSEMQSILGMKMLFKVEKVSSLEFHHETSFRVKRVCNEGPVMEAFDVAFGKESQGVGEVGGEEEFVEDTQVDAFVDQVIVSPAYVKSRGGEDYISGGVVVSGVINLDDVDDTYTSLEASGDAAKVMSAKRNLSLAFSECGDVEGSVSKISKISSI